MSRLCPLTTILSKFTPVPVLFLRYLKKIENWCWPILGNFSNKLFLRACSTLKFWIAQCKSMQMLFRRINYKVWFFPFLKSSTSRWILTHTRCSLISITTKKILILRLEYGNRWRYNYKPIKIGILLRKVNTRPSLKQIENNLDPALMLWRLTSKLELGLWIWQWSWKDFKCSRRSIGILKILPLSFLAISKIYQ